MDWWDGDGAARVLARDDDAILLERAEGTASLADMARNGRDDEACRVLCAVAGRLHASRPQPLPELVHSWTGLSAAWFLSDGNTAVTNLRVAELAAAELGR